MKRIMKELPKVRQYIALCVLLSIVLSVLFIFTSTAEGNLTVEAARVKLDYAVFTAIGMMAFAYLLNLGTNYFLFEKLKVKIRAYTYRVLHTKVFNKMNHLPADHPLILHSEELYTVVQGDTESAVEFFSDIFTDIVFQMTRLVFAASYIIFLNPVLFVIYAGTSLVCIFLQMKISQIVKKASEKEKGAEVALNASLKDILSKRELIKISEKQDFADSLYQGVQNDYVQAKMYTNQVNAPLHMLGIILGITPIFSVCLYGLYAIPNGLIAPNIFMRIFYMCQYIMTSQLHYADLIAEYFRIQISLNRISDVLEQSDYTEPRYDADEIVLKDVSYSYPNETAKVIDHLDLTIANHSKVALIGESGCGKSTLIRMISGLVKPTSGEACLRPSVYLEQFPNVFDGTIKQNIAYGNLEGGSYEKALQESQVNAFINNLEKKDEQVLANNGSNISGGQRQRVALARGLNANRDVYIFDESFAAIDAENASTIMQRLLLEKEKTMIFVLHQTEYLKYMDRLIYMEHGKIVFDGDYDAYCAFREEQAYVS